MQSLFSISRSVQEAWKSINPATLSGAIDVIVVEQADGSLACSPFHVRFGKFSSLRPYEKKVVFQVNDIKQDYSMKLGEGGEAFFIFETLENIPKSLQTSPIVSPAGSPPGVPTEGTTSATTLQEPEFLDINIPGIHGAASPQLSKVRPKISENQRANTVVGKLPYEATAESQRRRSIAPNDESTSRPSLGASLKHSTSEEVLSPSSRTPKIALEMVQPTPITSGTSEAGSERALSVASPRSNSPPLLPAQEALSRAQTLSKKLSASNIRSRINDTGDLMLDIAGYKTSEEDALRAEVIARKILAEELAGNYDIGALIRADESGNVWIYSSEEAKDAATHKHHLSANGRGTALDDASSDPGYQSDEESVTGRQPMHQRTKSDVNPFGIITPPDTPPAELKASREIEKTFAKTLRLTSDQLKNLELKPGENKMSFSVNRATVRAYMYYWTYDNPIVISDIDGTITKSDALGHVFYSIGRDWTHAGVAKLYTEIVANGYNILYLTSRSVGQADTTRGYLNSISQEGIKLPKGPVIMSPDRTYAALRREIYLRKPEVFKMACLRDILDLFSPQRNPFYAGFGNRLTDALSYRSVNIPSTRIFTINSNAEVSLDLLTLNTYRSSYVSMREIVDHFFPPKSLLMTGGAEEFTDYNYWRDVPLDVDEFSDSDDQDRTRKTIRRTSIKSEDEGSEGLDDEEATDELGDSYVSRDSVDEGTNLGGSMIDITSDDEQLIDSGILEDDDHAESPQTAADIDPITPTGAEDENPDDDAVKQLSNHPARHALERGVSELSID